VIEFVGWILILSLDNTVTKSGPLIFIVSYYNPSGSYDAGSEYIYLIPKIAGIYG
jgi:hypothetical protein